MSDFKIMDYQYNIVRNGKTVTATNKESGAVKNFTVESTDCEISGYREYLVDVKERYRVRLNENSEDGLQKAVYEYAERYLKMTLYKHP